MQHTKEWKRVTACERWYFWHSVEREVIPWMIHSVSHFVDKRSRLEIEKTQWRGGKKDRSRQTEAECSWQIVGYFLSSTTVPYRSGWLDPVLLFPGNPLSVASYNVDESAYRQAVCERLAAERIYCTLAAQCKVFCVCTFHNPASIYRISGQLLGDVCSFAFDQRALQKHISCHTFSHKHTQSSLLQRGGNWVAVQFFSFFLTLSHQT